MEAHAVATQRAPYCTVAVLLLVAASAPAQSEKDLAPRPDEEQLPHAMRSAMANLPSISVGQESGDLVGRDHRVLQAAVDFVAGLGGGTVHIGPGTYSMGDSLHLRSHVTVRGVKGKTILRKEKSFVSPLALDGDFGEEQVTLVDPTGFSIGGGIAVRDDSSGGFHTTVARITGQRGNTFSIDRPLMADCMVHRNARAATVFPVISAYHTEGVRIDSIAIDGSQEENIALNGCRGAGIFLYRAFGTQIAECHVRGYHGDGISFQQSNDVTVTRCVVEDNAALGIHPGSGSQRPKVTGCIARRNGTDGLFLCWRVRHGLFERNVLEENGRFGVSIGHKDSDNLLRRNEVRRNGRSGVFFRNESVGMAAHRNRLEENVIEDNGTDGQAAGIRVRGATSDLVLRGNTIRDTRPAGERTQTVGILIEERAGPIRLEENEIEADLRLDDRRPKT